ncbi:hypothetical protein SSX86_007767 [Deinandra increscens subsp. villosa]|uniref:Uncharacterized protein n=1 Tax=Deinandra increscens subsp. villosa TaxID=3103831 RepID=A0AAP0DI48_9ASTR
MGHNHLHELLKQDQEPFHLKTFISDRRRPKPTTSAAGSAGTTALNLRKPKPIIESTSSSATAKNFCINHVCLFSFQGSPDFTKSPFLDFPARELKSPCNNNTAVFLHIPARTAAMLLDAAARVVQRPKPGSKQIGLRLIGSFLRRLKNRTTRAKTGEIGPVKEPVTSTSTSCSLPVRRSRKRVSDDRVSSGVWSEKSSEIETSCSSTSIHEFEDIECFCSNSFSSFRFSLDGSPSPARREPDPGLSAASPSRRFEQDKESYEECQTKISRQKDEEKEQCSPVSILDPLFDDEDEEERDGRATQHDYDIECSYASVQSK